MIMIAPSYHDLYVTTAEIPRTRIFDLPFGVEVSCNRVGGWCLWDTSQDRPSASDPWAVYQTPKLLAGEYGDKWLVLDVAGHVIVNSRDDE